MTITPASPLLSSVNINLTEFPYFDDGDIQISLSPCERQLALHSRVLSKYFGFFKKELDELMTFNDFVRRVPTENSPLKTKRYELEDSGLEEGEGDAGVLVVKVCNNNNNF
jgi:hypothetical protein